MRSKAERVVFFSLVSDPHFEEVAGENITLQKEVMIFLESIKSFAETARNIRNLFQFFRREFVNVFIHGLTRIDLIKDTVQTGHQQSGVAKVRIGSRIRRAVLDAFGLWIIAEHRDANGGGTV